MCALAPWQLGQWLERHKCTLQVMVISYIALHLVRANSHHIFPSTHPLALKLYRNIIEHTGSLSDTGRHAGANTLLQEPYCSITLVLTTNRPFLTAVACTMPRQACSKYVQVINDHPTVFSRLPHDLLQCETAYTALSRSYFTLHITNSYGYSSAKYGPYSALDMLSDGFMPFVFHGTPDTDL